MATLSNALLAERVNDLVSFVQSRHGQLDAWMNGTINGGDFNNGTYPLTDYLDKTVYVRSPAQLEIEVDGLTDSAAASATQAANDRAQATLKAAEAALSEAAAIASSNVSLAAQVDAEEARDAAITAEINAIAQKQAAKLYSERAFELVDSLGALGSYSVDYGFITDLIVTIYVDGADWGPISLQADEFTDLGLITLPHNQIQNLGYL